MISEYEEEARRCGLKAVPPCAPNYREKWEAKYFNQQFSLLSKERNSLRYPDVYQNILIFDQRLHLVRDYWLEFYFKFYGTQYSKEEREEKFATQEKYAKNNYIHCQQLLYDNSNQITNLYITVFEKCLKKGSSINVYHDYGLLAYLNNNFDKSLELLSAMIDLAQATGKIEQLDSISYNNLGSVCLESMAYDNAIKYLSEAIRIDPGNKEAYLNRSAAYFETGNFDESIKDFLKSDRGAGIFKSTFVASNDFTEAFIKSACHGVLDSALDFVPSLCHSVHGLSKTLWAMNWSINPLNSEAKENVKNFANSCYEMGECVANYCKNMDEETVDSYVEEVKTLYSQFDQLNDKEKGELIGYTIGKYGVDIFAGAATVKGVQFVNKVVPLFRNLKNANRACNLEAICLSEAEKKAIVSSSMAHAAEREAYFKNIKIHWDKQNKHIPGKHNFEINKGIIRLESHELEALIKQHAGTGERVIGELGIAGYKERIDFGKIIGDFALIKEGQPVQYFPTSKGIITYDKNGSVHLWPSDPRVSPK